MNRGKTNTKDRIWAIIGIVPIIVIGCLYIASDFLFSDTVQEEKAMIFFWLVIILMGLSAVALYRTSGLLRIVPVLGLLIGAVFLVWLDFVANFRLPF